MGWGPVLTGVASGVVGGLLGGGGSSGSSAPAQTAPKYLPAPAGKASGTFYNPTTFMARQASAPGNFNEMASGLAGPQYVPQVWNPGKFGAGSTILPVGTTGGAALLDPSKYQADSSGISSLIPTDTGAKKKSGGLLGYGVSPAGTNYMRNQGYNGMMQGFVNPTWKQTGEGQSSGDPWQGWQLSGLTPEQQILMRMKLGQYQSANPQNPSFHYGTYL